MYSTPFSAFTRVALITHRQFSWSAPSAIRHMVLSLEHRRPAASAWILSFPRGSDVCIAACGRVKHFDSLSQVAGVIKGPPKARTRACAPCTYIHLDLSGAASHGGRSVGCRPGRQAWPSRCLAVVERLWPRAMSRASRRRLDGRLLLSDAMGHTGKPRTTRVSDGFDRPRLMSAEEHALHTALSLILRLPVRLGHFSSTSSCVIDATTIPTDIVQQSLCAACPWYCLVCRSATRLSTFERAPTIRTSASRVNWPMIVVT